jgi:hypothetical protein
VALSNGGKINLKKDEFSDPTKKALGYPNGQRSYPLYVVA